MNRIWKKKVVECGSSDNYIYNHHMIQKFYFSIFIWVYSRKNTQGNSLDDGNVPCLDYGGDYMGVYICQNWLNGTLEMGGGVMECPFQDWAVKTYDPEIPLQRI